MGYKALSYKDIEPILMKLRAHEMRYPGFVGAEDLLSVEDLSVVIMITTWETMGNWQTRA
jgi:heme-degrading monooxygenase HmoA